MSLFDNSNDSFFNHDDDNKHGFIDHNDIHETMHKTNFHEDIHDHDKIHEGMHLGNDKVYSPFNNSFNDNDK